MPTQQKVQKALAEIGKSAANYRYFFESLKSPSWLSPLAQAGLFTTPPSREEVEGGFIFPGWPASQYLARMANIPAAQAEVLRVVLAMRETDNVNVHRDLFDIACSLPAKDAVRLVGRVRAWVESPYDGLVKYHVGDLITHLATGGQIGPALQLARDVFALRPPPARARDEEDTMLLREPRAWLEDWQYEEALKKSLPALVAGDALHALELLCDLLAQAVALTRRRGDAEHEDHSYIWHDAIERDEYPPRLRSTLISAVRNATEAAINDDPANRTMVLSVLRPQHWTVFRRIELHVLRQFPNLMCDDVVAIGPALVDLEGSTRHEAALLLESAFPLLPAATQAVILDRIAQGPDKQAVVRWLEFIGVEATEEKIAEFGLHWRAQRYTPIAAHVPETRHAEVQEILARAGAVRRLDDVDRGAVWVGPASPKTAEDLIQMGPARTLAYLREWTPHSWPV